MRLPAQDWAVIVLFCVTLSTAGIVCTALGRVSCAAYVAGLR